jgi:hypothetical protein
MSTPNPVPSSTAAKVESAVNTVVADATAAESGAVTFMKKWGIAVAAFVVGVIVGHFL